MPMMKKWGDKRSPAQIRCDVRYEYKGKSTAWLLRKRQLLSNRLIVCEELLAQRGYGAMVQELEVLHLLAEKDRLP
jgi:hypothetical protein